MNETLNISNNINFSEIATQKINSACTIIRNCDCQLERTIEGKFLLVMMFIAVIFLCYHGGILINKILEKFDFFNDEKK